MVNISIANITIKSKCSKMGGLLIFLSDLDYTQNSGNYSVQNIVNLWPLYRSTAVILSSM